MVYFHLKIPVHMNRIQEILFLVCIQIHEVFIPSIYYCV